MKNPFASSIKLAVIFLVFGITWIISSDLISRQFTRNDIELYTMIQHSKRCAVHDTGGRSHLFRQQEDIHGH